MRLWQGVKEMLDKLSTKRLSAVFKALGHPTRLKIVEILGSTGPACVSHLVEQIECDQTTVSKHLAVLKSTGVVTCRREGLNVYYELRLGCAYDFITCLERYSDSHGSGPMSSSYTQPSLGSS